MGLDWTNLKEMKEKGSGGESGEARGGSSLGVIIIIHFWLVEQNKRSKERRSRGATHKKEVTEETDSFGVRGEGLHRQIQDGKLLTPFVLSCQEKQKSEQDKAWEKLEAWRRAMFWIFKILSFPLLSF